MDTIILISGLFGSVYLTNLSQIAIYLGSHFIAGYCLTKILYKIL